jgi:hypothetical protein
MKNEATHAMNGYHGNGTGFVVEVFCMPGKDAGCLLSIDRFKGTEPSEAADRFRFAGNTKGKLIEKKPIQEQNDIDSIGVTSGHLHIFCDT